MKPGPAAMLLEGSSSLMGENIFIENNTVFDDSGLLVSTNIAGRTVLSDESRFSDFFTLDVIEKSGKVTKDFNENVALLLDKKDLKNFFKYGNSEFLFQKSIEKLILQYPGVLHSSPLLKNLNRLSDNIINIFYSPFSNTTSMVFLTNHINNPMGVHYTTKGDEFGSEVNPIRDMTTNWRDYVLEVDGAEYPLLSFVPPSSELNSTFTITVSGDIFNGQASLRKAVYIKPPSSYYISFTSSLDQFESYLLERPIRFYGTGISDGNVQLEYVIRFELPRADDHNLDFSSSKYDSFYNDISTFFREYDETRGDMLLKLVPENVKSLTLEENGSESAYGRLNQMMLLWGNEFDVLHRKVKNLKTLNSLRDIPDGYIPMFIKLLGLDGYTDQMTNDEWRVFFTSLIGLWKMKGTKAAIFFLLRFFNIPEEIVEYKEVFYRANKIDIDHLTAIYAKINPDITISSLPVTTDGDVDMSKLVSLPLTDGMLEELSNFIPELPSYEITRTVEREYQGNVFKVNFDVSGNTFGHAILNSEFGEACYVSSGDTVTDPYPNALLDECGCALPVADITYRIHNTYQSPYIANPCPPIILDVVPIYNTTGGTNCYVTYQLNAYGGQSPYVFHGMDESTEFSEGEEFSVYAEDANGCVSPTVTGCTYCLNRDCNGLGIDVSILCSTGQTSGILSYTVTGGTSPYTVSGAEVGDEVYDGEIITLTVTDSTGCTVTKVFQVDCAISGLTCFPILFETALETTAVDVISKTATLTLTYQISNLAFGVNVDEVDIIATGIGVSNNYLIGSPVSTNFDTLSGAKQYNFDFDPDENQVTTMNMNVNVLLSDGCTYSTDYNLTVNASILGSTDTEDIILG